MTAQPIQIIEQPGMVSGTEAWHRARHATLGASERAAVMGMQPKKWPTRSELAERKIAPFVMPGEPEGDLRRGAILEHPAALAWQAEHNLALMAAPYTVDAVHRWMSATPDFYVSDEFSDGRLLEIKTALAWKRREFGEPGSADIPVEYLLQVQQQMAVTGVHSVELFVVFGEEQAFNLLVSMHDQGATDESIAIHINNCMDTVSFFVEFDQELEDRCIPILEEFWLDYVAKGIVPPDIKTMQHMDGMVKADEDAEIVAYEYYLNWTGYKRHERRLEELREKMEQAIGEMEGIDTDNGRFTNRKCKDTVKEVTDWALLAGDLFEQLYGFTDCGTWDANVERYTETKTILEGVRKFLVPTRKWEKDL